MSIEPGTKLGPYEIMSALGAGGMGEVYHAIDSRLGRTVAIKVLPSHLPENEQFPDYQCSVFAKFPVPQKKASSYMTDVGTNVFIVTSRVRLLNEPRVRSDRDRGPYFAGKIKKESRMKTRVLLIALFAVALMIAPAIYADTWSGWITDDHCGAKGANSGHEACALKCMREGARLVFYNNADRKIYKLDNQKMAKDHLGAEVEVTGEFDGDSIKVTSIVDKAASH